MAGGFGISFEFMLQQLNLVAQYFYYLRTGQWKKGRRRCRLVTRVIFCPAERSRNDRTINIIVRGQRPGNPNRIWRNIVNFILSPYVRYFCLRDDLVSGNYITNEQISSTNVIDQLYSQLRYKLLSFPNLISLDHKNPYLIYF